MAYWPIRLETRLFETPCLNVLELSSLSVLSRLSEHMSDSGSQGYFEK